MDFAVLTERAFAVRAEYERRERQMYGRAWTLEDLALGLVGDVGDLAKLVQAYNGVRDIENVDSGLAHELADVLWSVIVISKRCEIDLESAFLRTMDELSASSVNPP